MSSIFLSHNHADRSFASKLAKDLKKAGVKIWLDDAEIMIGDSLIEKIREGIDTMEYVGVILSPNSADSEWVKREVDIAMNQEISGKRVKVLPILLEDCDLPAFLQGKLYADFRRSDRYRDELSKLLRRLGKDIQEREAFEPEMVKIPASEFLMGSDPRLVKEVDEDETPQCKLFLEDYFLGKTPVTIGQYSVFVRTTGRNPPSTWRNYDASVPPSDAISNYPVIWVTWFDALEYCDWLSEVTKSRYFLPSEAEWEKGARGTDGRLYPWGGPWDSTRCYGGLERRVDLRFTDPTVEVDSYQRGASPYGLLQMVGNVEEWTRSLWGEDKVPQYRYPYDPSDGREDLTAPGNIARVVRGSCITRAPKELRCAFRNGRSPDKPGTFWGFRVAMMI